MALLDHDFIKKLATLGQSQPRFEWYITTIVALAALNHPENIGPLYTYLLEKYIAPEKHFEQTRKIKEALVKACGIHGAAKTGNALRSLYQVTPAELVDKTCYRADDDPAAAEARGEDFMRSLYRDIPDLLTEDDYVRRTCPDYFHVTSKILYAYIFSFDKILNGLESSQAIISSLIGIDCRGQAHRHMKGMLWNGATREEVTVLRDMVLLIAERLGVQFKEGPIAIPELPNLES